MDICRPDTYSELMEALQAGAWNAELGRFRSPFVFRGHAREDSRLTTSLQRLQGHSADVERHLVRAFRKYAFGSLEVQQGQSLWYWLALGQHHGLPTRLLDWSYSPLVALHFATVDEQQAEEDGAIWMLNSGVTNARLPPALRALLEREGGEVFTVEMLDALAGSLRADPAAPPLTAHEEIGWLETLQHEAGQPFLLFLEPPSLDQRIVQQSALFSLLSDAQWSVEEWLGQVDGAARKVALPAALKWEVRDRLDQMNVTERTLFPGLGGLSQWLRRYYQPRGVSAEEAVEQAAPEHARQQEQSGEGSG